jgi:solute carrier family 25 protein 16
MIPYAGVSFYTYESLKDHAKTLPFCLNPSDNNQLSYWATLTCGAISGMMAQTCSYPFEVIRRHMQVASKNSNSLHASMKTTTIDIISRRGFKGLFVGLGIGYLKVGPALPTPLDLSHVCRKFLYL